MERLVVSRRELLAAAGGAIAAMAIGGCGGSSASSGKPYSGRTLKVFNWSDYIDPELIPQFEERTGARLIYDNYDYQTQILVASVRNPMHVVEAAKIGADVMTAPPKIIRQLFKHPLTDAGLAAFLKDWEATGQRIG